MEAAAVPVEPYVQTSSTTHAAGPTRVPGDVATWYVDGLGTLSQPGIDRHGSI